MVKWRANHIFPKSSKDWAKIQIFEKQHLEGVLKSTRVVLLSEWQLFSIYQCLL